MAIVWYNGIGTYYDPHIAYSVFLLRYAKVKSEKLRPLTSQFTSDKLRFPLNEYAFLLSYYMAQG